MQPFVEVANTMQKFDNSKTAKNNFCSIPAGEVTVDFLTLLIRLVVVEWLLDRVFESDLVLCSCSAKSAFKELNLGRGGVEEG